MKKNCLLTRLNIAITCMIFCLIFLLENELWAGVKAKTYKLDDSGMSIKFPEDYIVFTRSAPDIFSDDKEMKRKAERVAKNMTYEDAFLKAKSPDQKLDITVCRTFKTPIDYKSFKSKSDGELVSLMKKTLHPDYIKDQKFQFHVHDGVKFLKYSFYSDFEGLNKLYKIHYFTVAEDNTAIYIKFFSKDNDFEKEFRKTIIRTVNSLRIKNFPIKSHEKESGKGPEYKLNNFPRYTYTDKNSKAYITVGNDWKITRQEGSEVHFSNIKESSLIVFSVDDVWSKLPHEQRKTVSRVQLGGTRFIEALVKEMPDMENMTVETINDREFVRVDWVYGKEDKTNRNTAPYLYLYGRNGYIYKFVVDRINVSSKSVPEFKKMAESLVLY